MRLWFSASSEVPIYRQMVTQVVLAILSGELGPGDRLPSTREVARRFGLHANTVSAGYKQLEREGWTEFRHGSGVYVRAKDKAATPEQVLDGHIAGFFRAVRELGLPKEIVRARVAEWLAAPEPDHFLVIDPDDEVRQILMAEIEAAGVMPVRGVSVDDAADAGVLRGAVAVCRPSKTEMVRAALPAGVELTTLPIRSATTWLAPWLPVPQGVLVAVVSHWPEFLTIARTMLVAAGLPAEALEFRDARKARWQRGLEQASGILCDAYTAKSGRMPKDVQVVVFPLLGDAALQELRRWEGLRSER